MNDLSEEELRRIEGRWKSDVDLKLDRVDNRVRIIERLVWIATGGVIVLSAVSVIGIAILRDFGTKLEVVSTAQASSSAAEAQRAMDFQRQLDNMRRR